MHLYNEKDFYYFFNLSSIYLGSHDAVDFWLELSN